MSYPQEGGCTCRQVRYQLLAPPMIVHCCHCRWCQRESGASFALNAMIEADRVVTSSGTPEVVNTPSASGKGQKIHRCPVCKVAVWSNYMSKQPWVLLPPGARAVTEYYDRNEVWSPESLKRREILLARAVKQ